MTDHAKIEVDEDAVSTDFPTLQDAITAWHRLRPEQAQRASIRIIGGQLYGAAERPKLLNGSRSRGGAGAFPD
jgi:hypothetical protein